MRGALFLVACLALLALTSCSKPPASRSKMPTDDPNWLLGYHQGLDDGRSDKGAYAKGLKDGIDAARDQVCDEIRRYSAKMAKDLNDNTEICGWPDLGASESAP